jgi:hypothetical protein
MKQNLANVLERASAWPEADQDELLRAAQEIEDRHGEVYRLSAEERDGIERGRADFQAGRVADEGRVAALLARFRK